MSYSRSDDIRTYKDKLSLILENLYNNRIFLSLSGKEPSESPKFLEDILKVFAAEENNGLNVVQKVMYSNLSGFVEHYDKLAKIIADYGLSRIETSRHHFDEKINQNIMNFRGKHKSVMSNNVYFDIIKSLKSVVPIRLVCVLQKGGISQTEDIYRYISWAEKTGINETVFRELSVFDKSVKPDCTKNYIRRNRTEIFDLLEIFNKAFTLKSIYKGYYYFSFKYEYNGNNVIFEMSDYEEMIKKRRSDEINKLIYYPNKDLCLDWNMQNKIF